jgi:hypothetical protein
LRAQFGLLTFGVFLLFVATWISVWLLGRINFENVIPLVFLSTGIWIAILAGVRKASHSIEGNPFTTFSWGMLFIVLGGSWYLTNMGMPMEFVIVFLLILIGALAVVTALR